MFKDTTYQKFTTLAMQISAKLAKAQTPAGAGELLQRDPLARDSVGVSLSGTIPRPDLTSLLEMISAAFPPHTYTSSSASKNYSESLTISLAVRLMLLAMDAQVQLPSRVISSMICMNVCACTCIYAFMYVSIYYACIYVSVVLHMYLYARIHCIQVYVFMYVCMCLVRIDIECLVLGPSRLGQRLLALR